MKKLLLAALLAAGAYFAWEHFSAPPARTGPVERLSAFLDTHVDQILGPLPFGAESPIPPTTQNRELRTLRENLRAMKRDAAAEKQHLYETAILLCDDLLRAGEERDRHIGRINDTRAKSKPSPLATDPERHRLERLAFFEKGIALSWQEESGKLRAAIDRRYRQLRELERGE